MASRESAPEIIAELGVPFKGVWRTVPVHQIPQDALRASLNVSIKDGELVVRPGLQGASNIDPTDRVTGAIQYNSVQPSNAIAIIGTQTKLYVWRSDDTLTDITGDVSYFAQLLHVSSGANNDLLFKAKARGASGNDIRVALVDPGQETSSESVTVEGSDITVTLRRVSGVLSTAQQVVTALAANSAAMALISVHLAEGDGSGVVQPLALTNLSGGVQQSLSAGPSNLNRFTQIVLGSGEDEHTWVVQTNGVNPPRRWREGLSVSEEIPCNPPFWTDVTTAFDRIVGIVPPYKVTWGEILSLDKWPALNTRNLADTPDKVVGIRTMGTMNLIVYKENSIWSGMARGGSSASAFQFDFRGEFDGPASPAAIVVMNNVHIYATKTMRIGLQDGRSHRWVGDGVWPFLRTEADSNKGNLIWGVYDAVRDEVWFGFSSGDTDLVKAVVVIPPKPKHGVSDFALLPEMFSYPISMAFTFNQRAALFAHGAAPKKLAVLVDDAADFTQNFSGFFNTGLYPTPKALIYRPEVEVWVGRQGGAGTLTIKLLSAKILENAEGTLSAGKAVDLTATPIIEILPFEAVQARFFGLRGEFTTPITLRYKGARILGRMVEQGQQKDAIVTWRNISER